MSNQATALQKKAGRPMKFQSVEELEQKINRYFAETPEDRWTWTGLAIALDTNRETLNQYKAKDAFSDPIRRALAKIEEGYEIDNKKHGRPGSIFALKNFGWRDKQEIDQHLTGNLTLSAILDAANSRKNADSSLLADGS